VTDFSQPDAQPTTVSRVLGTRLLFAIAMAASLVPSLVSAQTPCGPYTVAYYEYGAFNYRNEAGDITGIDKLLVEELARRSGCTLDGEMDSRVRTWSRLEAGTLAMTVSAIETPERQKYAEFVPYFKSRNYVLMKRSLAATVSSLEAFNANAHLRLAVVKSFKHGPEVDAWVDRLRAMGRVSEYGDAETVARLVALGRADAFLAEPGVWGPLLKHSGLENFITPYDWFPHDGFVAGLALSRSKVSMQDAQRLRLALQDMTKDGTLGKIYRLFLDADIVKTALP
jgi:polar amino acid transport system substrate-binding protein